MAKKLSIQLNQNYKSFNSGYSYELQGNLIILSGVNGSGKSQLIDIISQRETLGSKKPIAATILLDGDQITRNDILRRSFKDNVNIPDLTHAGTESVANHKNNAWNAYNNHNLDFNNENLWDYKESCENAKKILVARYDEERFKQKRITQTEFKDALPSYFVWKSDDIFTNFIGELFFNYSIDVYEAKAKAGESGKKFDQNILPVPPWKQLNDLFAELGFEYRFKDNYFITNLQINEQPCIYQVKSDGSIDENEQRKLADLSDGEKAIISLTFASLSGVRQEERKVLLLDEFDANFNPSLTEIFFKILDRYFIAKSIPVVMATHSSTTIALAPSNATFYEVFKKSSAGTGRVLPVLREDYAELAIANKTFYTKIANQQKRIDELNKEKDALEAKITESQGLTKPTLFVEGEIDVQYLVKAAEFYPEWQQILEKMELKSKNGEELHKYRKNKQQIKEFLQHPLVLLFDCDMNQVDDIDDTPIHIRRIPKVDGHSLEKGIENLFNDELILKAEKLANKKFTIKSIPNSDEPDKQEWVIIDGQKKNLANWICANGEKDDFQSFELIFNSVKDIVGTTSIT